MRYKLCKSTNIVPRRYINLEFLKIILQKLKFLKTIKFEHFYGADIPYIWEYNEIFKLILKNCNHLTHIDMFPSMLYASNIFTFIEKYSKTIKSIRCDQLIGHTCLSFLKHFSKCKTLIIDSHFTWKISDFMVNGIYYVTNLSHFSFCFGEIDLEYAETFFYHNQTLKILEFRNYIPVLGNKSRYFYYISSLKNLRKLILTFYLNDPLCNLNMIKNIALKCNYLCSIDCRITITTNHNLMVERFLLCLDNFVNLKHLSLRFDGKYNPCMLKSNYFKQCPLRSLSLPYIYPYVDYHFFEGFAHNFPNITHISIYKCKFDEFILNELSQLRKLEVIQLYLIDEKCLYYGKEKLLLLYEILPKLEIIKINNKLL